MHEGINLALRQSKMLPFFKDLFKIYGLNDLEDLTAIDEALVKDLEEHIRSNRFGGSANLTKQDEQLRYLGGTVLSLENFTFTPMDRKRLVTVLPKVARSIQEEMSRLSDALVTKRSREEMMGSEQLLRYFYREIV